MNYSKYLKPMALAGLFFLPMTGLLAQQKQHPSHRFYLKATGSYFFSVSNGQFPNVGPYPPYDEQVAVNPSTGASTVLSEKVLTGSYGAGVRAGLSGGYEINKYISVEASFNYFHSKQNLMTRTITTIQGTSTVVGTIQSNGHVNAVDIAPSLVISPGYTKWNPYVRFGFAVPLWGRLYIVTDATATNSVPGQPATIVAQTTLGRKEEVKPAITIGFQGAMGLTYTLNKRFGIFLETEYRNIPVKSDSKKVTSYHAVTQIINTTNGQPVGPAQTRNLSDLSVAERNTNYVTTLDQGSNTPVSTSGLVTTYKNDNIPANDLKSYINIGGLGINLGVKFRL